MADGHLQPESVTQLLLDLRLPDPRAAAVRAAGVRQHQQAVGVRKGTLTFLPPPVADRLDREARRIEAVTDHDIAVVPRHVVDSVGNGLADRVLRPVMHQHRIGLLTPALPGAFEVTDQLLFFRINADDWCAQSLEVPSRGVLEMVPLRSLFEQMGATVSYDPESKTVDVSKPGSDIKVTVGKAEVVINGESRPLDVPPEIYEGTVVVPLRVISEGMGADTFSGSPVSTS